VDRTAAGVQEFGAEFADNGWQAEVGEAVNQLKTFLDKSMREKPVATMAGAVALAYCIGAMLRKG
jgi:hypothetical protein